MTRYNITHDKGDINSLLIIERLDEQLLKATALVEAAMAGNFKAHDALTIHTYLWVINDYLEKATDLCGQISAYE